MLGGLIKAAVDPDPVEVCLASSMTVSHLTDFSLQDCCYSPHSFPSSTVGLCTMFDYSL